MQNLTIINICGRIISIEDNAWQMQKTYIETLHCYFVNEEGRFEIINDIENRIAELMQEITNTQNEPVNRTDMDRIIRIMGTIDEFKELDYDDWDLDIISMEHCNITTPSPYKLLPEYWYAHSS